MSRKAIFPSGPIHIGPVANASLSSVRKPTENDLVATYTLTPRNESLFVERMEALRGATGFRYSPVPGFWSSFVIRDGVEGEDDALDLLIGADARHLDRHAGTVRLLKIDSSSIVSPVVVRSLALGYLQRVGA